MQSKEENERRMQKKEKENSDQVYQVVWELIVCGFCNNSDTKLPSIDKRTTASFENDEIC